jgi:hypothetical protein
MGVQAVQISQHDLQRPVVHRIFLVDQESLPAAIYPTAIVKQWGTNVLLAERDPLGSGPGLVAG